MGASCKSGGGSAPAWERDAQRCSRGEAPWSLGFSFRENSGEEREQIALSCEVLASNANDGR